MNAILVIPSISILLSQTRGYGIIRTRENAEQMLTIWPKSCGKTRLSDKNLSVFDWLPER